MSDTFCINALRDWADEDPALLKSEKALLYRSAKEAEATQDRIAALELDLSASRGHCAELERELAEARAELAEWNDPDSSRRQALMEEIILDVGDGQRSEVDLREAQLDATEAALKQARAELAEARAAESYRGMETLLLQRDKMIAELRGELTAAQSVLEDQREALEAIGCESADAAHWAAMKRQRDQAQSELAQARAELEAVRKAIPCSVCGGTGSPLSGSECVCGGAGTETAECLGMHIEAVRLGQRLSRLEAVVRDLEWGGRSGASQYCPTCGEERSRGHMEYCALAAALGENGEGES